MKGVIMSLALFAAQLPAGDVLAVDTSNSLKLLAVGDRTDNFIDLVDLELGKTVYRIVTRFRPDHVLISPYAPILLYTGTEQKLAVFYNLASQQEIGTLALPVTPRHVVLDTSGGLAGITDSLSGGFVLLSLYGQRIEFALQDFPPTADVLFDPNQVDIYYSNSATGSIGLLDRNVQKTVEIPLADSGGQHLSSPSRSLDARYLHVANEATGEVYSLNAFSRVIYRTFTVGPSPARPYTTPQGAFLYLFDDSGRFVVVEQETFREYAAQNFSQAIELVVVGRFDRFNLLLGTRHRAYYVYDNVDNKVVAQGLFEDRPVAALGAADGKTAYVAFANIPRLAMFDLENQAVRYFTATEHGAGAFAMGLSNTVCH